MITHIRKPCSIRHTTALTGEHKQYNCSAAASLTATHSLQLETAAAALTATHSLQLQSDEAAFTATHNSIQNAAAADSVTDSVWTAAKQKAECSRYCAQIKVIQYDVEREKLCVVSKVLVGSLRWWVAMSYQT